MSHEITTIYTHETADELVRCIITQAMADDMNVPYVPAGNRFHIKISIILMDKVASRYIVEKVGVLDSWNEVSGFFHKYQHRNKIYDLRETCWEVPSDVEFADIYAASIGSQFIAVVGDRIVDKDYNVWKIIGFHNQNGSEVYGNIL